MSSCPACNKTVDPLRSRFVGVVDGKVVGFCSAECVAKGAPVSAAHLSGRVVAVASAAAAASDAVLARVPASPQTPATGVPVMLGEPPRPSKGVPVSLESGPVIEIVREPGSAGVRAKHPDEISMAAFWSEDKEREKSGAVVMPRDAKDKSGLNKLPAPSAKDASGLNKVPAAKDAGAREAGAKPAGVSDEPSSAKPSHARSPSEPELELPRKSRMPLVLLVLLVLVAGGFALYRMLAKGDASAATPSTMRDPPPPDRAAPGAGEAAAVRAESPRSEPRPTTTTTTTTTSTSADPAAEVARATTQAREVLARGLTSTSPRIQHLAATALSRTQDPAARASLVTQLGREASEIAKLDLAYALARSGDKQGSDLLAAGLRSTRGEVRDEAARLLALLGDARAIPHLLDLLAVAQRHLGGAEQLARLGEPHGLLALQQLRADPRASADDKARATIALGLAGVLEPDALRALLGDPHQNMFAAAALADRHDAAAAPVLRDQLASPALRVRAARGLRRLDAEPGPTVASAPQLPALVTALGEGSDPYQVSAAEAILLLTGPAAWADRE